MARSSTALNFWKRSITSHPPKKNNTKIVVVTSSSNKLDMDKAKALGANEYLTKLLQDEQLTAVLKAPEKLRCIDFLLRSI
jgi:CheY-like chemotaxis protein